MSKEGRYYSIPLSILRSGDNERDVLEACACYGIVNAGIGYRKINGETGVDEIIAQNENHTLANELPNDSEDMELFENAFIGVLILGINGGRLAKFVKAFKKHRIWDPKAVFFTISSEYLWGAFGLARGDYMGNNRPLTWREFRVLAAILSAPVNTEGFTVISWDSIQARACGYHTKELFKKESFRLPKHCEPLGRQIIRDICDNLETNKFFARVRIGLGRRGGRTAYSFRHPEGRADLQKAVIKFMREEAITHVDEYRASDFDALSAAFGKAKQPTGNQSITNQ